jgi:hypothetical protein
VAHRGEWRPKTCADYEWQLCNHLLPFFGEHRLSQITIREVDRYRALKVADAQRRAQAIKAAADETEPDRSARKLRQARDLPGIAPASINKTITRLGQILEVAVEYELLARNPARGKSRRVKASKPAPVWFDRAEQIRVLLDAAGELDREAPYGRRHVARRGMLGYVRVRGAADRGADRAALARRRPERQQDHRAASQRPTPACARSLCCRYSATSWPSTKRSW